LKKAYITARNFTIGYASSTFSDPAACPSTVDAQGPNNKVDRTSVLIRYMPRLSKNITTAISVENPQNYISADGVNTLARGSYIPDIAAMIQYDWGHMASQHIRLSAIYRSLPYRNLIEGTNHNKAGWGVQLSSVSHPADPITLYLTANFGAGYEGMGGDLLVGNCDLIGDPDRRGYMYAPRAFGWCAGLQYNFRPNLYMTVIASQSRMLPSKTVEAEQYKYGMLGTVNIFWNPVPRVMLGAEYDMGKRHNFSRANAYSHRFGIVGQLSF
ncbi:MAG: porin, partial [Muribaculaceae bacterium]|nr:porin [Muribaculaceae bacterium]